MRYTCGARGYSVVLCNRRPTIRSKYCLHREVNTRLSPHSPSTLYDFFEVICYQRNYYYDQFEKIHEHSSHWRALNYMGTR